SNVTGSAATAGTAGTVTTAAQPTITSVGTLTGLTMGGTLAMGTNNITMTGSLGATGSRLTKGWFTDLQVTNAISGSVTGNAGTATSATTATNLASGAQGSIPYQSGAGATAMLAPGTAGYILQTNGASANPSWVAAGGTSFANPTASVGLSAVNGSATTAMRSDAAPALSQAIVPTWTGAHTFSNTATFGIKVSSNAYLATAGGNVGIGTSTPEAGYALDVIGKIRATIGKAKYMTPAACPGTDTVTWDDVIYHTAACSTPWWGKTYYYTCSKPQPGTCPYTSSNLTSQTCYTDASVCYTAACSTPWWGKTYYTRCNNTCTYGSDNLSYQTCDTTLLGRMLSP
ncbi:MAG: hypothetical protein ABIG11_05740, partial [bacterium]